MGKGIPLDGDRSAKDALNYPEKHTNDLNNILGMHHTLAGLRTIFSELVHHTRHESGGADAIKLDDLSAPDDNTDNNVSTAKHGLMPKLSNSATQFLNGVGAWVSQFFAFKQLTDAPASYMGQAGKIVRVKATEDGVEFAAPSGGGHTIMDEGVALAARTNIDFAGAGVTVTDVAGSDKTLVTIPGGGGGGGVAGSLQVTKVDKQTRTILYDNVLAIDGSWDIQNIDQTYDHLEIRLTGKSGQNTPGTPIDYTTMCFNNDTTVTNYRATLLRSGSGSNTTYDWDLPNLGYLPCASNPITDTWGSIIASVQNYTDGHKKQYVSECSTRISETGEQIDLLAGEWENTSAINRITIKSAGGTNGNLLAGSRLQIIGIKKESIVTDVQSGGVATPVNTIKSPLVNLITNGDFSNGTTGWLAGSPATIAVAAGQLTVSRNNAVIGVDMGYQDVAVVAGHTYLFAMHIIAASNGIEIDLIDGSKKTVAYARASTDIIGFASVTYKAIGSTLRVSIKPINNATGTVTVDDVALYDLTTTDVTGSAGLAADQEIYGKFLLYDNTVNTPVQNWVINNIDQSYDHLEINILGRADGASPAYGLIFAINNDSVDANYRHVYSSITTSGHTAGTLDTRQSGAITGAGALASDWGEVFVRIPFYTGSQKKAIESSTLHRRTHDDAYIYDQIVYWENIAPVQSLTVGVAAGINLISGSRIQVFGYKKTRVASSAPVVLKNPFLGRPTGTLLRQYTFDSDVQGWSSATANLTNSGGALSIANPSPQDSISVEPLSSANVDNGELYFTFQTPVSNNVVGPIIRYTDINNFYMVILRMDENNNPELELFKRVTGSFTSLGNTPAKSQGFIDTNAKMKMLVRFSGSEIQVYLNDAWMGTFVDSTFTTGKVGWYEYSAGASYLDNVQVYSIPSNWDIDTYIQSEWLGTYSGSGVVGKVLANRNFN